MKPLLGSLLLASFCTLSSRSVSSAPLVVNQSHDVSVPEGNAVSISCCWTGTPERKTANWLKNQTCIKREVFNLKNGSQGKETSHCLNLTFTSITREDSGRYTCRVSVETPSLIVVDGDGTVITVQSGVNTKDDTTGELLASTSNLFPVIIPLAVVALLLLGALVCVLRRRQVSARAARVIYEVPHIDSEEAEMDKRSTSSSTGSSQWCQVPVYESCDYFERVQTKESG